ncbi:MAG TPA: stage II sporulation protein M [Trueperaceae bacterium]
MSRSEPAFRALFVALLFTLVATLLSWAGAQYARGADPAVTANRAVETWLEQEPPELAQLSGLSPAQLCETLPGLITNPAPEPGTRVNLDDRQQLPAQEEGTRIYSYSAVRPGGQLEVVQVTLEREGEEWVARTVGYRLSNDGREWLQQPETAWIFGAFTILVLYLLFTPSFLRGWLVRGLQVLREHRGVVLFTMILLYGVFALGVVTGSQLPEECEEAALTVVNQAITAVGASEAYGSGNVSRAAAVTFYQNFVVVTLSVTFSLALLFGIPAYLLSVVSFYVQAIPFGLVGAFGSSQVLFVAVLILLELTAYFLVVAGGGILLRTLLKNGFSALPLAVSRLALMLPIAMLLLLIGAWYEAGILLLGTP